MKQFINPLYAVRMDCCSIVSECGPHCAHRFLKPKTLTETFILLELPKNSNAFYCMLWNTMHAFKSNRLERRILWSMVISQISVQSKKRSRSSDWFISTSTWRKFAISVNIRRQNVCRVQLILTKVLGICIMSFDLRIHPKYFQLGDWTGYTVLD